MSDRLFLATDIPSNLMSCLGALFNTWQLVETCLEQMIWGLSGLDEIKGRAVTYHMPLPLKLDVFRALYHDAFKDAAADKALNKLIQDRIKPAHAIRNRYAHAMWLRDEQGNIVFLEKTERGKPYLTRSIITENEITRGTLEITVTMIYLANFLAGSINYEWFPDEIAARYGPAAWNGKLDELLDRDAQLPFEIHLGPSTPKKPQFRQLPSLPKS